VLRLRRIPITTALVAAVALSLGACSASGSAGSAATTAPGGSAPADDRPAGEGPAATTDPDDPGDGTPATTADPGDATGTSGDVDPAPYVDAMTDALLSQKMFRTTVGEENIPCAAEAIVHAAGADRLEAAGITPAQLRERHFDIEGVLDIDTGFAIAAELRTCGIDLKRIWVEMATSDPAVADCLYDSIPDDVAVEYMAASIRVTPPRETASAMYEQARSACER